MSYYTRTLSDRAEPSAEWIKKMRDSYPVERVLEETLTKKLLGRNSPAQHQTNFQQLETRLLDYLSKQTAQNDILLVNLQRLSGGASKEQFTFNLTWDHSSGQRITRKLILRMDPGESIVATNRLREAQMLKAMWGEVPVPEVFWCDSNDEYLGYPFLIAGFLDGVVQPEGGDKASGLGMYFEPSLRDGIKDQFVEHLAHIHKVDWRKKDLSHFDKPRSNSTEGNDLSLAWWERVWQEDAVEAHPIVENAANWLRENMPVIANPVIVHGDYRSGNFMYTPDNKINAILDWELSHLGDFHEDLAFVILDILGTRIDSDVNLCCGLMPKEEFLDKYQQLSGNTVDPGRLFYFEILCYYKAAVIAAATSLRTSYSRKTHLDAMMNLVSGFGYVGISALQRKLENY